MLIGEEVHHAILWAAIAKAAREGKALLSAVLMGKAKNVRPRAQSLQSTGAMGKSLRPSRSHDLLLGSRARTASLVESRKATVSKRFKLSDRFGVVELMRFELTTSAVRLQRSPN